MKLSKKAKKRLLAGGMLLSMSGAGVVSTAGSLSTLVQAAEVEGTVKIDIKDGDSVVGKAIFEPTGTVKNTGKVYKLVEAKAPVKENYTFSHFQLWNNGKLSYENVDDADYFDGTIPGNTVDTSYLVAVYTAQSIRIDVKDGDSGTNIDRATLTKNADGNFEFTQNSIPSYQPLKLGYDSKGFAVYKSNGPGTNPTKN